MNNHYQIIIADTLTVLEDAVNEFVKGAWIPIGAPFFRNGDWHQAIYKSTPSEPRP